MILGRVAAFSYSDCSKSKIFRRRRKKSYEQWITSSENTKNKYKNNRTLEHHVNMERFIGIIIPFM